MEVDEQIDEKMDKSVKNNFQQDLDNIVSFRYVLYEIEVFYNTERIIQRGSWCPSISMIRQAAEISKQDIERKQLSPKLKPYCGKENVVILLNRFKYRYSIESSLTNRSTTQRGSNGTEIADLRIDVENIIYNETIHYLTHLLLSQDGINCLTNWISTPEKLKEAFTIAFKHTDKALIVTVIRDELRKDIRFKKDEKACQYLNNDVKVFVSWFDYRTTFFAVTKHVQNVLDKQRNFC